MPIVKRLYRLMLALALCIGVATPAAAQTAAQLASAQPTTVARCAALAQTDFTLTRDAPFKVLSGSAVTDGPAAPYCRVRGYLAPEITFEMRLPLTGWNHGFVLVGSGGWANENRLNYCREPLSPAMQA